MHPLRSPIFIFLSGLVAGSISLEIIKSIVRIFSERTKDERKKRPLCDYIHPDITSLIGNTPMMELKSLSNETGCKILAKLEFMNPGGSPKDRVALRIIKDAESKGLLKKTPIVSTICEGTVGSTGISLALLSRALGYQCQIFMPDDQAKEKSDLLKALGAQVEFVRPLPIQDDNMYVNRAKKMAAELGDYGFFADQFETRSNFLAHYEETGPEIWKQTHGKIDALVLGAGTGGTISGVSKYLKEQNENIKVCLVDPPGSGLYNKIKFNVLFSPEEREGRKHRNQVDTIVEGVGINRITNNFALGNFDDALKITDLETVSMSRYLMKNEGLFVGSSSAINCVGAVKLARQLGPGHTIVTILCDSGTRHLTKFWSESVIEKWNLKPSSALNNLDFVN